MTKIRTLIIDDELLARDLLRYYLSKDDRFELVGECTNGFEGALAINELKPDLVFLDIQMPKITGFEMLELIPDPPVIIFSTAFDQFAIRAFEANSAMLTSREANHSNSLLANHPATTAIHRLCDELNQPRALAIELSISCKSNDGLHQSPSPPLPSSTTCGTSLSSTTMRGMPCMLSSEALSAIRQLHSRTLRSTRPSASPAPATSWRGLDSPQAWTSGSLDSGTTQGPCNASPLPPTVGRAFFT